jgi:hypothetical protein
MLIFAVRYTMKSSFQAMEERGIKAKSGRIPSPLHHHRMLPLYTPALRYILTVIRKFYRFLTFFGLVCASPLDMQGPPTNKSFTCFAALLYHQPDGLSAGD